MGTQKGKEGYQLACTEKSKVGNATSETVAVLALFIICEKEKASAPQTTCSFFLLSIMEIRPKGPKVNLQHIRQRSYIKDVNEILK